MAYFDESLARLASDALGRRIRGDQGGVLGLQTLQLFEEAIEFLVADRGLVEYVVKVFVMTNFFAKSVDFILNIFASGHWPDYSRGRDRVFGRQRIDLKILETSRLILREFVPADANGLELVLSDRQTMRFYPAGLDRAEVEQWIARNLERYRRNGHGWQLPTCGMALSVRTRRLAAAPR